MAAIASASPPPALAAHAAAATVATPMPHTLLELRGGLVVRGPTASAPASAPAPVAESLFVDTSTGRIVPPPPASAPRTVVDCAGCVVAPGFVDLQFNGGWGVDFSVETVRREDVLRVLAELPRLLRACISPPSAEHRPA